MTRRAIALAFATALASSAAFAAAPPAVIQPSPSGFAVTAVINGKAVAGINPIYIPQVRAYVRNNKLPVYYAVGERAVGEMIAVDPAFLSPVPAEFGATSYGLLRINEDIVLIDPDSLRVMQILSPL